MEGPVPKKRLIERKRRLPEDNKLRDTKIRQELFVILDASCKWLVWKYWWQDAIKEKLRLGDSHDLKTQGQSELHGHGNILGKEIRPSKQKGMEPVTVHEPQKQTQCSS